MRILALLLSLSVACTLHGQSCPKYNANSPATFSAVRALSGTIIFHNDLRHWFELKLDKPACDTGSIELVAARVSRRALQRMRGCRVTSLGKLGLPGTGYYSATLYQDVSQLTPSNDCRQSPPFSDFSRIHPARSLQHYAVDMRLHYQTDGPLEVAIISGAHRLVPWQAYASYDLTGSFAYYAYCAQGFLAENATGTREGKPWLLDGYVVFDPESVPKGIDPILLRYDCRRSVLKK